jgi:hypothetical protein
MGILDKIFGKTPREYPPLDSQTELAEQLKRVESELQSFAETIDEDLEIVPASDETFVFFGEPPKVFGLAWIREGQVKNLSEVIEEKKIPPYRAEAFADLLRAAYKGSKDEARYSTQLAGRSVVVTPSDGLRQKVHEIVEKLAA